MDKAILLDWYRQMVLIRRFEQRCAQLYQLGQIGGFLHLYIGQEAVVVGTIAARRPEDNATTAYRDHGHALMVGSDVGRLMAELMGKATGVSRGRGGSMHLADVERRYWGGYGIVGGQIALGVGLALAEQYKGTQAVTLIYFGDGATNIGYFHEAMNLAAVWDLPVLFICENNLYGMGTSVERASAVPHMVQKAQGYAMPAEQVNGMDVGEVYTKSQAHLAAVREGGGPHFLEIVTYRFEGHSMGDPLRYRTKEEVHKWRENDPIGILEKQLLEAYAIPQAELDGIDDAVDAQIEAAVKFAEESPFPTEDSLFDNIYVEEA